MTCAQVVDLVTAYLEDVLDADDRERVEEHLVFCDGCSTYLDQIRQTIAVTGRLEPEDIPPALQDKLLAAFREWSPA
ncbi:MAG: zf-HC2 domain-containing protein [Actinobacteria bacterium]|nr:MAG: zf-HC2 domain-containing protein [Actinomycetota bacterium]